MKEELSKEYYIQEKELCVLLAMKGQNQLYGICMDGVESIDHAELYQLIFLMLKKGILNKTENVAYGKNRHHAYHIEESLEHCIDLIKKAKRFVVLANTDETVPEWYFYVAEKDAVMLQPSGQGGFLHIEQITKDRMCELVKENIGILYCGEATDRIYDTAKKCWQKDKDNILQNSAVKQLLQEYDITTQCKKSQVIRFAYGLDEFLVGSDKNKSWTIKELGKKGEELWF